ncbi:MAG: hypothetical protein U1C12_01345 [Patescibacteria group bacterium]|nr:hypothetical protein [bacterium]MDZ4205840.1 hypothetical protein [Patescibacteria group bacterium]
METFRFERRVEGKDEKPFEKTGDTSGKEKLSTEMEKYSAEAQAMLDGYGPLIRTFAKDVSLTFKIGKAFFIDLEKGEVNMDVRWFVDRGFTREQILWAVLHELSHFRDLVDDPEHMMKNFDYIQSRAKSTGAEMMKKWETAFGESDPEMIEKMKKQQPFSKRKPGQTMNSIERAAYQVHHTFYNILDDMYVNAQVARKAPAYEEAAGGGEAVKKLYKEKLFAKTDYSSLPRHLQFMYKLLRDQMVPDEAVVTNDEVGQALETKIRFHGKEYTPKQLVAQFIKPRSTRDTKAGQRYFVIQQTLEPVFQKLLIQDIADWQPEKPQEQKGSPGESGDPEEGEGQPDSNPFSNDYKEFENNSPDQLGDDDVKDWADKHKKETEDKEAKKTAAKEDDEKTPEEKAAEAQERSDEAWCTKNNIELKTLEQFRCVEREVAPYLQDLSQLWGRIIFGSSRKVKYEVEGHFKTGPILDMQKTIGKWAAIEKGDMEKVRVMERRVSHKVLIKKPRLIRVRLVGDLSGSMDTKKRHVLEQCTVLLLSSLYEFNSRLNLERTRANLKLEVDTEAWAFGSDFQKVKPLRRDNPNQDDRAAMIQMFEKLQANLGFTEDFKVLDQINAILSPAERKDIKSGEIMEIVFEVTDGGSTVNHELDSTRARRSVDTLLASNVVSRAFQIGAVNEDEKMTFNAVWNNGRDKNLGEIVGENIANLLPAVTSVLKEYLGTVRL